MIKQCFIFTICLAATIFLYAYCQACSVEGMAGEQPKDVCLLRHSIQQAKQGNFDEEVVTSYLFYGNPGAGKKTAVYQVVKETEVALEHCLIESFDGYTALNEKQSDEASKKIYQMYEKIKKQVASTRQPIVVLIDRVDLLGDLVAGAIRAQIDMIRTAKLPIFTTLTAKKSAYVEGGVRGRCAVSEFKYPNYQQRYTMLLFFNMQQRGRLSERQLSILARVTGGFLGKDLKLLVEYADTTEQFFPLLLAYSRVVKENKKIMNTVTGSLLLCTGIGVILCLLSFKTRKTLMSKSRNIV